MADSSGMDEQTQAEQFDTYDEGDAPPGVSQGAEVDDVPPDTLWGAEAYGAGGTETPDAVAQRAARENPEQPEQPEVDETAVNGLYEQEDGFADDEDQMVGQLDNTPDGRPTSEEAAVHLVDEDTAVRAAGLDPEGPPGDGYVEVDGEVRKADDGLPGEQTARER